MKHSLRTQMTIIFVGLVALMLLIFFLANGTFLEQYYVYNKTDDFQKLYKEVEETVTAGLLEDDETQEQLVRTTEKSNISLLIIDETTTKAMFNNTHDMMFLYNKLVRHILGQGSDKPQEEIKTTDEYTIYKSVDYSNNNEYMEMLGEFHDENQNMYYFIMRSPIESIRESVDISNKFLAYVGTFVTLLSVLAIWYFARRLARPILELTEVSNKMTELDFDAKYTSGGSNEIGILGANFNTMSEKLETTISELKNANYELQKDIEKKEKIETMRTEFLGNVSHELKTPIALIQGYAEGLKESVNDDSESREFYCDVIMDEANKMNQMVKNLMALNQVESGADETQFERFDITTLIRGVLQSCDILIQQKQVKINFVHDEAVYVWGDQFKIEQVVRNFVSNALNHAANEKIIEIKLIRCGEKVRITVFNTGQPIPAEDVERIWEKFYKVDKAHTREYGGNGIGLSIVKAIMESFKQGYGIKNYDNGVEFWFELDIK